MAYSRSSSYPYPYKFKTIEDAEKYAKQLYDSLRTNDSRSEELGYRVTNKDLKELIVRPEWYGTSVGTGGDDTAAIQAAITAAGDRPIQLADKTYNISSGFLLSSANMTIRGSGTGSTIISTSSDITPLTLSAQRIRIFDLTIKNTGTSTKAGVLLLGGASLCEFSRNDIRGFEYAIESYSDATGSLENRFDNNYFTDNTKSVYIHTNGGRFNENYFYANIFHDATEEHVYNDDNRTNGNKFIGNTFEKWGARKFAVKDAGNDTFYSNRFEDVDGYGIYHNGSSGNLTRGMMVFQNYFVLGRLIPLACVSGRVFTDVFQSSLAGYGTIHGAELLSTTVDVESLSGQKVLSVASTTGLYPYYALSVDEGNANEEWNLIDSISSGDSVTFYYDLINTHSIGVAVKCYGYANYYQTYSVSDGYDQTDIFINSIKAATITSGGTIGAQHLSLAGEGGYAGVYGSSSGLSLLVGGVPKVYVNSTGLGVGGHTPAVLFEARQEGAGELGRFRSDGSNGNIAVYEGANRRGIFGYGDDGHVFTGASADSLGIRSSGDLHFGSGDNLALTISSDRSVTQKTGSAPTASATDGYKQYSADIAAGNAAPHFRTEAGDIIKLYAQAHVADAKADYTTGDLDSEAEIITALNATNAKLNALLAVLENNGSLKTS